MTARSTLLRNMGASQRLIVGVAAALIAFFLLPSSMLMQMRLLAAWDAGAIAFLVLAWTIMSRATPEDTRKSTLEQDQSGAVMLTITVIGASASMFAIAFILRNTQGLDFWPMVMHLVLAMLAVIASWTLTHTLFAFHYAHRFYHNQHEFPDDASCAGLDFPGGRAPDYLDFMYFSFVVGMTSQTSDTAVTSRGLRRLTLIHGVLSFAFNTTILALSVNIVAGKM